jgi:peptide/nickel transport system permease protein
VIGLSLTGLLGGAFVVEWIFNWPGLGTLAVEAINAKDYPVIQGFVLVTAAACVVVNFLTDLVYASLDPRVRLTRDTT